MNIFILDYDQNKNVEYYVDKHIIKMILEYAQMLCTANRLLNINEGYKATYINHPCSIWTRESLSNWIYLKELAIKLNQEYKFRYNKNIDHKSIDVIKSLTIPSIQDKGLTQFKMAMPDCYKTSDIVTSYRNYYNGEKRKLAKWTKRNKPWWWRQE